MKLLPTALEPTPGSLRTPVAFCSILWNLLPEDWATTRKKNKIANLLSEMKREGLISNKGNDNLPCWVRNV